MIRHYSSIIFTCHPFQTSPISLLRVVLVRSVLLLILKNYKKNGLDISSTGSFPCPMSMDTHIHIPCHPYDDGDSTIKIQFSVPENYSFESIISDYFTGSHLLPPPLWVLEVNLNGVMGISITITESKIHISYLKHHDSTLILSSIIFTCHAFQSSNPRP